MVTLSDVTNGANYGLKVAIILPLKGLPEHSADSDQASVQGPGAEQGLDFLHRGPQGPSPPS